jgi:hypothetical protein
LEPHPASIAEFIIECHLRYFISSLASLAALGPLPLDLLVPVRLLSLQMLLIVGKKSIVVYLVEFYFSQVFL